MVEFPEIARRRLQHQTAGPNHPDPGLLTAFVEGSLPDRWRDQLLAHLAACSSCNELVALTATEPVSQTVLVKPAAAKWNWSAWAPLRWASVAAVAAVVAGAVWIGRIGQNTTPAANQVAVVSPATTNSAPVAQNPSPSVPAETPSRASAARPQASRATELAKASPPRPDRALPRLPADAANVVMESGAQPALPSNDIFHANVTTSRPPEVSNATPATASPNPANPAPSAPSASVPAGPPSPQWAVSGGVLQNSLDGGKTWYPALSSQPTVLRTVYSFGNQVWVGGNDGFLLHSADAGRSWSQLTVSSGDEKLAGDIIRITFATPDRGLVTTAAGVAWLTSDGGRTWKPMR